MGSFEKSRDDIVMAVEANDDVLTVSIQLDRQTNDTIPQL